MLAAYILMFCRITIALVFALAFTGKLRDIKTFQEVIVDFRLLPARWSKGATWGFLAAELASCLLIAIGGSPLFSGFLLAAGLLTLFSIGLVIVIRRKMRVTCNCFGWTDRRVSIYDVARNTLFILCCALGAWACVTTSQNLAGDEFVLIGLIAVYFVVLATNLSDVVETLRQPFHVLLDQ